MPEGKFYSLGKDPKKMNDVGREEKMMYPHLSIRPNDFPPLKEMKMGDKGRAEIEFQFGNDMCLEVTGIKSLGSAGAAKQSSSGAGKEKPAAPDGDGY